MHDSWTYSSLQIVWQWQQLGRGRGHGRGRWRHGNDDAAAIRYSASTCAQWRRRELAAITVVPCLHTTTTVFPAVKTVLMSRTSSVVKKEVSECSLRTAGYRVSCYLSTETTKQQRTVYVTSTVIDGTRKACHSMIVAIRCYHVLYLRR